MFRNSLAFSSYSIDDVEKARTFYRDTLGLDVSVEMDDLLSIKIGNDSRVLVYSKQDHTPATFTVLNFPVDNIEQTVDELTRAGVRFEQYDLPDIKTDAKGISRSEDGASALAWFKDPAGNILSVMKQ